MEEMCDVEGKKKENWRKEGTEVKSRSGGLMAADKHLTLDHRPVPTSTDKADTNQSVIMNEAPGPSIPLA